MSTQPEALRLADRLRDGWGLELRREAEAELRRLHEENEALREANEKFGQRQEWWNERMFVLESQRDALREALQDLYDEQEGPPLVRRQKQWQAAIDKARAALAEPTGKEGLQVPAEITALRSALADGDKVAPTEPVAWMDPQSGEVCRANWLESHAPERDVDRFTCALYTAPPQRKPQAEGKPWRCSCGANLYIDAEGNPRSKA